VTCLRCGGIFSSQCIARLLLAAECADERVSETRSKSGVIVTTELDDLYFPDHAVFTRGQDGPCR